MKIWAYNDSHDWGTQLATTAASRSHDVHLFEDPRQPDEGHVFFHMHHQPQVRILHKRCMAIMAIRPELRLVPSYRMSNLFDDKLEQARQLAKWMPRTQVFYSPAQARKWLDRGPAIPFMSKTSEGESAHNVRLITDLVQAKQEIRYAFSDIGIKCRHQQTQRGYLLWQEYIASEWEVRVIAVGRYRLILRRNGSNDGAVAQGKGKPGPVIALDEEMQCALTSANHFFDGEQVSWGAVDMVKDENGRWYVTECTVRWTLHHYYECPFFLEGRPTDRCGDKIWDVLVDELEAGVM